MGCSPEAPEVRVCGARSYAVKGWHDLLVGRMEVFNSVNVDEVERIYGSKARRVGNLCNGRVVQREPADDTTAMPLCCVPIAPPADATAE